MPKGPPMPPTYLYLAILLMVGLRFIPFGHQFLDMPWRLIGLVPLVLGFAVSCWGSNRFHRVGTTVKPFEESSKLVTTGPYAFSRHPMYLGFVMVVIGVGLLLDRAAPFVVAPPFAWILNRFAVIEERQMEATFGEAYEDCRRKVRRWI